MTAEFPIVDAHQHFWDPLANYHPWLRDEPPVPFRYGDYSAIRRPYLSADFGTILSVEAVPQQLTSIMLSISKNPYVLLLMVNLLLLTPPMGLALFLVADIAKVTMKEVLREMMPYYVPLIVTLLLITYVPAITTWIPRLAMGP